MSGLTLKSSPTDRDFGTLFFLGGNSVGVHLVNGMVVLRFGKGLFAFDVRLRPQDAEQIGQWLIEASKTT